MRKLKYSFLAMVLLFTAITSCKDDSIVIVPEWESGVHGYTVFSTGSAVNFTKGEPAIELSFDMLWNSIDQKNTVEKIELFALFNEAYLDQDGNPKTAKHGGDEGVLFLTLEGAAVPDNKEAISFTLSQQDMFDLYDGATFDYFGTGALPVWGAGSIRSDRTEGDFKFVDGDSFQVRWELTTDDGRVFSDWGVSVCTEFPGANCAVNWLAVCSQDIKFPEGNWTINMNDSYGDGWNGAAIRVVVDGTGTNYTLANGSSGQTVVAVPPGTTSLTFEFVSGDWDSEVTFSIVSPRGNQIAKGGPSPPVGVLTVNLCVDNG